MEEKREEVKEKEEVKDESVQFKQKKQSSDDFDHEISLDLQHKEDKEELEFDTGEGKDDKEEKVDEEKEKVKETARPDPGNFV